MSLNFNGVVRAVADAETRSFEKDGKEQLVSRLRVVSESGPLVDKELEDGRTVKERKYKEFFNVEGWGGTGRALAMVNKGEAVYVSGQLRQADPVEREGGEMFYPKDTLRVSQLDFIGANKAATSGLDRAVQAVDQEVDAAMSNGAEMETF